MKRVLIITALLGISACATNIDFDLDSEDCANQDVVEVIQDPMIENNERMIEDARRDGRLQRN
ncbi:hypothetical protein [Shewanella benthica]|uniref:Lipoprotein n=1 Tax=Shewanella benthica KT99 TaxID=314608 RepID=A9EIL3_9GAMM|nr:hypothetical protein [Shewanella benthica]EDP99709.1 hypothetical protein KT99_01087 [Shewanella benthica KT99]